jgi:regulatory protein
VPASTPLEVEVAAAQDVALRYLAQRPRSEEEVRRRLRREKVADEIIEQVLDRLRTAGLVDDDAFARYWLEQRQTFQPRGVRLLRAELRQHGISTELAAAAADSRLASAEDDAYRAAQKRARALQSASADEQTFKTRLTQFLARRGFDWDTIASTVERLHREVSRPS